MSDIWKKTKENISKAFDKTIDASEDVWDKTREIGEETWDKAKIPLSIKKMMNANAISTSFPSRKIKIAKMIIYNLNCNIFFEKNKKSFLHNKKNIK